MLQYVFLLTWILLSIWHALWAAEGHSHEVLPVGLRTEALVEERGVGF